VSDAPSALWMRSRAKLNLQLRVTGRRADGYHLLDTLFHALELHDDVAVHLGGSCVKATVTADAPSLMVPSDERNLVVQAVQRLLDATGADAGFHIVVHKRIPNGGGLGGGSSNAACALRMANALLGAPLDHDGLARLAVGLGADVPFFLRGGTQRGRGVGDELSPEPWPARHFVLLLPPYGCDTAAVYKIHARGLADEAGGDTLARNVQVSPGDSPDSGLCNDLEAAAEQLRPSLRRLRELVAASGYANVRMSGSGSTLFVMTDSVASATSCRDCLQGALAGTEHREVGFALTRSAGDPSADQPSSSLPDRLRHPSPP